MTARIVITGANSSISPFAFQDIGRGLAPLGGNLIYERAAWKDTQPRLDAKVKLLKRTSEDRLETLQQVPLLPLPGQLEGRSQKGEANLGRKPVLSSIAGIKPGLSRHITQPLGGSASRQPQTEGQPLDNIEQFTGGRCLSETSSAHPSSNGVPR